MFDLLTRERSSQLTWTSHYFIVCSIGGFPSILFFINPKLLLWRKTVTGFGACPGPLKYGLIILRLSDHLPVYSQELVHVSSTMILLSSGSDGLS